MLVRADREHLGHGIDDVVSLSDGRMSLKRDRIAQVPPFAILLGLLDYRRDPSLSAPWGGPFNGQGRRARMVEALRTSFGFEYVVETGTHRGTTTEWFSTQWAIPVFSIEVDWRYCVFARRRLRGHPNITIIRSDSRKALTKLARSLDTSVPCFFYLDAHWGLDLPLREEVAIITRCWEQPCLLIDDFLVPSDVGYGYDDLGPGKVVSASILPPLEGYRLFLPAGRSAEETGSRRGCALIVTESAATKLATTEEWRAMTHP